ncbi:unnamed protein product [Brachionus calyciflorus]|uniref:Uncharacterized protein n=1 Tax=Brachionus calyciflorus TaxID=104777 RepID=A0A813LVV9_9BILA|nr:unnamed protein product [Brachionus calyciflorus]
MILMRKEEIAAVVIRNMALQRYKPHARKKLYLTKDGLFGAFKEFYLSGVITFKVYMKRKAEKLIVSRKKKSNESCDQDTDNAPYL